MEDYRLLVRAAHYMNLMAEGKNPLTETKVPYGDTLSEPRVQKCCEYIGEVLERILTNGRQTPKPKRSHFILTDEQRSRIIISDTPIGVMDFARNINSVKDENMRGISGVKINEWLIKQGYLSVEKFTDGNGEKTRKVINERSAELDIISVDHTRIATGEVYKQIRYGAKAQEYVINHLEDIIRG